MLVIKFAILFTIASINAEKSNGLILEQVVLLGRHHIRNPLHTELLDYSPRKWPSWYQTDLGLLTNKGVQLERYLSEYISKWMAEEGLINGCPAQKHVLLRPNTLPRTVSTAKVFAKYAFPNCNINITVWPEEQRINEYDPLFRPLYHYNSETYKNVLKQEMEDIINGDNLTDLYMDLNRILNIENSNICKKDHHCDLVKLKTGMILADDEEPDVTGALAIAYRAVDAFLMAYYEGLPLEDIGWGQIITQEQWQVLVKALKMYQKYRFHAPSGLKDVAAPLLHHIYETFENGTIKFTLFIGHDSNLNPVTKLLFQDYVLPFTNEPFPIGGTLLFQKWRDEENRYYLKVEYVYQTEDEIRVGEKSALIAKTQRVLLKLKNCGPKADSPVDMCLWEDFESVISELMV